MNRCYICRAEAKPRQPLKEHVIQKPGPGKKREKKILACPKCYRLLKHGESLKDVMPRRDKTVSMKPSRGSTKPEGKVRNPQKAQKKTDQLEVIWRDWDHFPRPGLGHGVEFLDTTIEDHEKSIVAFLDGYDWLHGDSNEAVIYCITPNLFFSQDVLARMKKRIEELIKTKRLGHGKITPRIFAWFNA